MSDLVGSVSRCLEIWRAARQAGKCPRRGRVALGRGEGHLPETHRVIWREPHGTTAGVGSHLQSALLQPAPHCPLQKGSREEEKCLTLQRGSKGNGGPRGAASSPMSSCMHVVAPLPHGVCCCCHRCGHQPGEMSDCPLRRGGKAMTGFYSLFQPNSHTLGLRHK